MGLAEGEREARTSMKGLLFLHVTDRQLDGIDGQMDDL
jgi:hypothetical protein